MGRFLQRARLSSSTRAPGRAEGCKATSAEHLSQKTVLLWPRDQTRGFQAPWYQSAVITPAPREAGHREHTADCCSKSPRRGPHKAGRARGLPSLDHSPAQQMPFLHHPRGLGSRDLTLRLPSSALSSSKHLPLQEDSQQSNQQMLLIGAFCFSFFSGSLALSLYQRTTGSGQTPREPKASESCFSETSRLVVSPCPCPTQEFTSVSLRELHLTPLPCPPAPHRSHPLSHHLTAHGR